MVLAHEAVRRLARGRAGCYTCVGARNGAPYHNGPLAQLAEQLTLNQRVRGSSPRGLTTTKCGGWHVANPHILCPATGVSPARSQGDQVAHFTPQIATTT